MFVSMYNKVFSQYYELRSAVLSDSARKHELCYLKRFDKYIADSIQSDEDVLLESFMCKWISSLRGSSVSIANEVIVIRQFLKYLNLNGHSAFIPVSPKVHDDYAPYIQRMMEGEENLLSKNAPVHYALTTGSIGVPKYVPVSEKELKKYVKYSLEMAFGVADEYYRNTTGRSCPIGLGLNAIEMKVKENVPTYTIFSDNDSLLIGKNGKNLNSLSLIVREHLSKKLGENYRFIIDVSDYKQKNDLRLERLAKKIAREVKISKVEVKLDPMNSYERRIIHNALTNNKFVTTESTGTEPNRAVVIKPKEESDK